MPDLTSHSTFSPYVGNHFRLHAEAAEIGEAELVSVTELNSRPARSGNAFSLIFRVPKSVRVGQGTYQVEHPKLGQMDIFMVPVGLDEQGLQLEAIFN